MQKKYCLLILAFAFTLGTMVAALPPVKAQDPVSIYVKDPSDGDDIYPPKTPGGFFPWTVSVFIDSPLSWFDTSDGIIAYSVSVRVDPTVLEAFGSVKVDFASGGFLDTYAAYKGWATIALPGKVDKITGTIYGYTELISGAPTTGAGGDPIAGDNEMELMRFQFKSYSDVEASPFDLIGIGGIIEGIDIACKYTNARDETYYVEPGDGWYIGETPDKVIMGEVADPFDPTNPIGSRWHELWPNYCEEWVLESWDENGSPGEPGVLDASDQIDMKNSTGHVVWFHVDWLNEAPVGGDGKADMIATVKPPVPEFPLGIELMMALVLAIPVVYLLRTRRKVGTK